MKIFKLFLAIVAVSFMQQAIANDNSQDWKLVWSDEFEVDGVPNPEKWNYEYTGFLRNKELQWYTNSQDNAFVKDGKLHLVARKEKELKKNPWYKENSKNWKFNRKYIEITSAGLVSRGKGEFKFGRIEMRAKMPKGQGVWPAFWTIGVAPNNGGWPNCGEIDIVEFIGKNDKGKSFSQGAMHWKSPEGKYQQKHKKIFDQAKLTDDFHVYGIEWNKEKITFYIDNNKFFTVDIEKCGNDKYNAFRVPHFLLLNLAVGGTMGGNLDPNIFPASYIIDYVRVYQKK